MPKVLVLPEHIASQIAAGEVVERPSSVVKELVENSIDAGASKIVVSIAEGCRSIRVADNGCGMDPEDAVLAFQRHATSKLASADQLWSLHTLGFRGEALPSIASIARVTCYTCTADSTIGTQVVCVDGTFTASEVGCAKGTVIEVTDLFFNVPARLKFLKKASTEFGQIHEIVQSLAIAYPSISFELFNDGELKLATLGFGDFTQTIIESGYLQKDDSIIDISAEENDLGLALTARITRPTHFRGDRKGILSIVNRRPVRCHITYKALDYAYADLIPRARYPMAVLHLTVKPSDLDINIHPTKKEIKYANGNEVYAFIQRQLIKALRSPGREIEVSKGGGEPNYSEASVARSNAQRSVDTRGGGEACRADEAFTKEFAGVPPASVLSLDPSYVSEAVVAETSYLNPHSPSTPPASTQQKIFAPGLRYQPTSSRDLSSSHPTNNVNFAPVNLEHIAPSLPSDWRLLGYLQNTYFLVETSEGFLIVEQHIAHERVIYENLLALQALAEHQADPLQKLIISCPLSLTVEQLAYLEDHLDDLKALGFDFEEHNGSFACTQVPAELAHKDYPKVVQEILQSLSESASPNIKLEITKSIACQSAVKNGMRLSDSQILKLLGDWYNAPRNDTCPHGRPIKLAFTMQQLFQMFHPQ